MSVNWIDQILSSLAQRLFLRKKQQRCSTLQTRSSREALSKFNLNTLASSANIIAGHLKLRISYRLYNIELPKVNNRRQTKWLWVTTCDSPTSINISSNRVNLPGMPFWSGWRAKHGVRLIAGWNWGTSSYDHTVALICFLS